MYDEYDKELNRKDEGMEPSMEDHAPNFVMMDSREEEEKKEERQAVERRAMERQTERSGYQAQTDNGQGNPGYNWQNRSCQNGSDMYQSRSYQSGNTSYQGNGYQGAYREDIRFSQDDGRKPKKKGSFFKKVFGIAAAAILFGVIAGGTMVGVDMLADSFNKETYPQVSSQEIIAETTQPQEMTQANVAAGSNLIALDVSDIVEAAMPSVVAINNTMLYQSSNWWGMTQTYEVPSSGSGIIIGQNEEELLIATNNHVVEDSQTLAVVFIDQTSVNAAIKGTDPDTDLAVIAVPLKDIPEDTLSQITVAQMGNSDDLKVGQGVIAIGNALGYGQSVTVGYVSALNREVKTDGAVTRNLLQTDAAINPGNSGGALLNMKGEVIGINAAKYSSTEVEGMGYAIPISAAQEILDNLMTKRTRLEAVEEGKEGYLGIQGLTVDNSMVQQYGMPAGVYVYGIIADGAASKSELREKDIITKFDGQAVKTMAALQDLLKYYKAGETVEVTVQSLEKGQYEERVISITLGEKATIGQATQK